MTSFESYLVGNNTVVVDEDGIRISNSIKAEGLTLDWDTYYAIHQKISDFYEMINDI